jgi:3-methyladenine DNA glycosylase/8-oxoguanine DNA glycosylase
VPVHELSLRGAGGEPVDLWRTIVSHGVASLPPQEVDEEARTLTATLLVRGRARTVVVRGGRPGFADIEVVGRAPARADAERLLALVAHMLRLDVDLSAFYALIGEDDDLSWAAAGAGRMLRSPTVFEDVVKTICTTNCAWSGTVRMVSAIVRELGAEDAATKRRAFPTPAAMAAAPEEWYRDVARAGYRGAYLRTLATEVAEGRLDLEQLNDPALSDDEAAERLLELPGVGPYAAAHVMMLIGRHSRLVLDSWTRPTYARLAGKKTVADRTIERRFRRYREHAGLAFWLYLTRGWVADDA